MKTAAFVLSLVSIGLSTAGLAVGCIALAKSVKVSKTPKY